MGMKEWTVGWRLEVREFRVECGVEYAHLYPFTPSPLFHSRYSHNGPSMAEPPWTALSSKTCTGDEHTLCLNILSHAVLTQQVEITYVWWIRWGNPTTHFYPLLTELLLIFCFERTVGRHFKSHVTTGHPTSPKYDWCTKSLAFRMTVCQSQLAQRINTSGDPEGKGKPLWKAEASGAGAW